MYVWGVEPTKTVTIQAEGNLVEGIRNREMCALPLYPEEN